MDEEAKHAIVIHRDKFVDAVVWCAISRRNALKRHLFCASVRVRSCVLHPQNDTHRRNPWIDKAKATADFGDDEYMVRSELHT